HSSLLSCPRRCARLSADGPRRVCGRVGLRVEGAILPRRLEVADDLFEVCLYLVRERLLLTYGAERRGVRSLDEAHEVRLEASGLIDGDVVELAARRGPDNEHLLLDIH